MSQQHILALETSGAWCGVALCRLDGARTETLVREFQGTKEHSERLLPMVDEVLAEAGIAASALDAIAFGQGPGGFTGLRVACGVAQGLGFALSRPLVPVISHAALAWDALSSTGGAVLVAMDARMEEIYAAAYRVEAGVAAPAVLAEPVLIAAADLLPWTRAQAWSATSALAVAGDAWDGYADAIGPVGMPRIVAATRPTARAVAEVGAEALRRGAVVEPDAAAPRYVRDKVAFTTAERATGAGGNPRASAAVPLAAGEAA